MQLDRSLDARHRAAGSLIAHRWPDGAGGDRVRGDQPYALEADGPGRAQSGTGEATEMSLDDSLGNAKVLDAWRERDRAALPVRGRRRRHPDRVRPAAPGRTTPMMPYGEIAGLDKPVSRLVMGCDNQPNLAHASAMFDHFFAAGGNAFDTAYIYGGGLQERCSAVDRQPRRPRRGRGRSPRARTRRTATPSRCRPAARRVAGAAGHRLRRHLPDAPGQPRRSPVEEFVDVLDAQVTAGRIKVFGGSNWTPARIDEANAYAETHRQARASRC